MSGIDIVGEEANALAKEIYGTLCGVSFLLAILSSGEARQSRESVIRCIKKLEEILEIPEGDRLRSDVEESSV